MKNETRKYEGFGVGRAALVGVALVVSAVGAGCAATTAPATPGTPAMRTISGEPGTCLVVQRGNAGKVSDTRIAERWPDRNYGEQSVAFTGAIGEAERDVLLGFDVSTVPAGSHVTRATVVLHESTCATCSSSTVTAHNVLGAWDEHTTTWRAFGGAYDKTEIARATGTAGEMGAASFDITALAQDWVNGSIANHGLLLRRTQSSTTFSTSEAADASQRPRLEICFAPGPGPAMAHTPAAQATAALDR